MTEDLIAERDALRARLAELDEALREPTTNELLMLALRGPDLPTRPAEPASRFQPDAGGGPRGRSPYPRPPSTSELFRIALTGRDDY